MEQRHVHPIQIRGLIDAAAILHVVRSASEAAIDRQRASLDDVHRVNATRVRMMMHDSVRGTRCRH